MLPGSTSSYSDVQTLSSPFSIGLWAKQISPAEGVQRELKPHPAGV